jgi:exosome complex RNA-binding protein Rrp4
LEKKYFVLIPGEIVLKKLEWLAGKGSQLLSSQAAICSKAHGLFF